MHNSPSTPVGTGSPRGSRISSSVLAIGPPIGTVPAPSGTSVTSYQDEKVVASVGP